jgi:phosphoglycerol transferase MdoB-like AlkP superfamily enzyme
MQLHIRTVKLRYVEMKTLFRLPIAMSIIWLVLAFLSFFFVDFYNTKKITNSYYSKCMEQQATYPKDTIIEVQCKSDRDKILNEWEETKFVTPCIFAFLSLGIFWFVGFVFVRTSKWTQSGD